MKPNRPHSASLEPPPTLPRAQDTISATQDCESLPQRCCSRVRIHLPTALLGYGPCQAMPTCRPASQLSLSLSLAPGRCPILALGLPWTPLAGAVGQAGCKAQPCWPWRASSGPGSQPAGSCQLSVATAVGVSSSVQIQCGTVCHHEPLLIFPGLPPYP